MKLLTEQFDTCLDFQITPFIGMSRTTLFKRKTGFQIVTNDTDMLNFSDIIVTNINI